MTAQDKVREFHEAFDLPVRMGRRWPSLGSLVVPLRERKLRRDLLREEHEEYVVAELDHDLVEVADALADIVYIAYGTALAYGIDLDAVINEVHRSNMTKLQDGRPVYRNDGKVLKGPGYEPPRIAEVLSV